MFGKIKNFTRKVDRIILGFLQRDSTLPSASEQTKPFKVIMGAFVMLLLVALTYVFFLYYPSRSKYKMPSDYVKATSGDFDGFMGKNIFKKAEFIGNVMEKYKGTYGEDFKDRLKDNVIKTYKKTYGDKYDEKLKEDFMMLKKSYGERFVNQFFNEKEK